jgi:hypothetical protein
MHNPTDRPFALYYLHYIDDSASMCRSSMEPSCTMNPLTRIPCLPLRKKKNDSMGMLSNVGHR